ncbi:MAG: hypothetical protein LBS21_09340 [Clostridiales bacterium]|jgi:hypothetical protein|nr:hypothetical protein [Clostridiales bacterium]
MAVKGFCAGICNDGLVLAVVKSGKISAQKYLPSEIISDGVLTSENFESLASEINLFLSQNKSKPKYVKVFIKSSRMIFRLRNLPYMNKRDLEELKRQNTGDIFPSVAYNCGIYERTVISDSQQLTTFAAAVPKEIAEGYINLFAAVNVKISKFGVFQDLVMQDFKKCENMAVVIENCRKSFIMFFENSHIKAVRDLAYRENSFASDFENVLAMYFPDTSYKVCFIGERYAPFAASFEGRAQVFGGDEFIDKAFLLLCGKKGLNILPKANKNALKRNYAIKVSAAAMAVIFFLSVLSVWHMSHIQNVESILILELIAEQKLEKYIESQQAAEDLARMRDVSSEILQTHKPVVVYDTLLDVFSCLPPGIRLVSINLDPARSAIALSGVSETDSDILSLTAKLSENFSGVNLTRLRNENSFYSFGVSFVFRSESLL